jgi:hypothetical protein
MRAKVAENGKKEKNVFGLPYSNCKKESNLASSGSF